MAFRDGRAPRAILRFCVATTMVSILFWVLGSLVPVEVLVPGLPVSAGMFIAPAIGAWCATGSWSRSVDRQRPTRPEALLQWLLWLPLMPAVLVTSFVAMRFFGMPFPAQPNISVDSVVVLSLVFLITSACEEAGWTRFLTAVLTSRWSLLATGVVVGGMWAALHVIPYLQAGRSGSWVAWQCAFTLAFRLIIVAAVELSGGSWSVAVALHAAYDVAWASFPVGGSHYDPAFVTPIAVGVALWLLHHAGRAALAT